ncbi:hypothetical protein R1sor_013052 [Riccia sorocarpa]|uniref:Phytocyanin domain-containing protein n=1 Tax=Riccia sorocarpa TaxID=122646 RepID=A0ABD3H5L5_9MARC
MTSSWAALWLILSFSSQLVCAQEGRTYSVGNSAGWTYINASSGKPADYTGWASQYQFYVKDVLRFRYEPSRQSIYLFSKKESWDNCDLANGKLLDAGTSGSYAWTLPTEGYYHVASGIYCNKGQKFKFLAVNDFGTGAVEAPMPEPSPSKPEPVSMTAVPDSLRSIPLNPATIARGESMKPPDPPLRLPRALLMPLPGQPKSKS